MTLLNEADAIYLGGAAADRVYLGPNLVWEPAPSSWGPNESMYLASATPATYGEHPNTFSYGAAFAVMVPGRITAIRYYLTPGMLPSRNVSLWANDGSALLASVNATGGVAGWNTVPITPVINTIPTAYRVVAGHSGSGAGDRWPYTNTTMTSASANLRWDAGVYSPDTPSGGQDDYPSQITGTYNYFVDVVFQAGVASFAPTDIADCVAWLDASQLGLANNASLSAWPNLAGGPAINIVTDGILPLTMKTGVLNGLPVVRFMTSGARIRSAWPYPVYDWTLIYLFRWPGGSVGRAFSVQYPPSNLLIGCHTTQPDVMYDNGTWLGSGTWAAWSGGGPWRMYGGDSQATVGSRFFIDGTQVGPLASGVGGFTSGWGLSGYEASGTGETMDMEVAELVIYKRKLLDAERIQIESYLRPKWGLA